MFQLPPLLSWRVTHTGTVPCDSFSVTFVYQKEMAEVLALAAGFAAAEKGETMLRAIVDEYAVDLDENGLTATVSGRGYAARLLDNESRPVTYQQATLAEILANHAQPYGITCREEAAVRAETVYTVAAGSSQWKAVESFCRAYGGFSPRFSREGGLLAGINSSASWRASTRRCWTRAASAAGCSTPRDRAPGPPCATQGSIRFSAPGRRPGRRR